MGDARKDYPSVKPDRGSSGSKFRAAVIHRDQYTCVLTGAKLLNEATWNNPSGIRPNDIVEDDLRSAATRILWLAYIGGKDEHLDMEDDRNERDHRDDDTDDESEKGGDDSTDSCPESPRGGHTPSDDAHSRGMWLVIKTVDLRGRLFGANFGTWLDLRISTSPI